MRATGNVYLEEGYRRYLMHSFTSKEYTDKVSRYRLQKKCTRICTFECIHMCAYVYIRIRTRIHSCVHTHLRKQDKSNPKPSEDFVFFWFRVSFILLAWCACPHYQASKINEPKPNFYTRFPDDCAHRFSSKEQQRLSSK